MEGKNARSIITAAGAALASTLFLYAPDANAQEAQPQAEVQQLAESPVQSVSQTPTGSLLTAGADPLSDGWLDDRAPESAVVPENQILLDDAVRRDLGLNHGAVYVGSLIWIANGQENRQHSYDLYDLTGEELRLTGQSVTAVAVDLNSLSEQTRRRLGISEGNSAIQNPDRFERTTDLRHLEGRHLANYLRWDDNQIRDFYLANVRQGEGVPSRERIFIVRYYSQHPEQGLSFAQNGGDAVADVLVQCPDEGFCRGEDGRPIGRLAGGGSQEIDLPGPYRLLHWMIVRSDPDHPIVIRDPSGRELPLYSRDFVIPRYLMPTYSAGGASSEAQVEPSGNGGEQAPVVPSVPETGEAAEAPANGETGIGNGEQHSTPEAEQPYRFALAPVFAIYSPSSMLNSNGSLLVGVQGRAELDGLVLSLLAASNFGAWNHSPSQSDVSGVVPDSEAIFTADNPANTTGQEFGVRGYNQLTRTDENGSAYLVRLTAGSGIRLNDGSYFSLELGPVLGINTTRERTRGIEDTTQIRLGEQGEWSGAENCQGVVEALGVQGFTCQDGNPVDKTSSRTHYQLGPVVVLGYSTGRFAGTLEAAPLWELNTSDREGGVGGYIALSLGYVWDLPREAADQK